MVVAFAGGGSGTRTFAVDSKSFSHRLGRVQSHVFHRKEPTKNRCVDLVRISFACLHDADQVICKNRVATRQRDPGHVAAYTI
jgi:hypothetical protein